MYPDQIGDYRAYIVSQAIFKGKQGGGGNCPRSEIICPHSEYGKQETGGGEQRQIACPSSTIPRTDVSTCYHAPADHIQGSPSMAKIPNL